MFRLYQSIRDLFNIDDKVYKVENVLKKSICTNIRKIILLQNSISTNIRFFISILYLYICKYIKIPFTTCKMNWIISIIAMILVSDEDVILCTLLMSQNYMVFFIRQYSVMISYISLTSWKELYRVIIIFNMSSLFINFFYFYNHSFT